MRTHAFESREEWLNFKLGKISGSRLKDVLPDRYGNHKKGFYELVAERLIGSAAIDDDEKAMDRGTRLEPDALERFQKETGKKVDTSLLMWTREDDTSIALSPDGVIGKTAAVEVKCLNAASHIEAKLTGKIPKNTAGYEEQAIQYFVVNESLKTLFFAFYDPRFPTGLDFFYIEMKRKDVQEDVVKYLEQERTILKNVRDAVNCLTMYSPEEIAAVQKVEAELLSDHRSNLEKLYTGVRKRTIETGGV